MLEVRSQSVVAGVAERNQISLFGDASSRPRPDVMHMKLDVNMVLWVSSTNSAALLVAFDDAHPQFRRGGSLHGS